MKTTKKKSFKRLFAFLMAFVMVTALAANAVFAAGSFTDVKEGDDFYENIESLYEQGIIGGFPDGTFQPGEYLTRQQAAKMIALAANYGDHDGTGSKLVDVAGLTWGRENIWALEAAGVVKGFGTSKEFRPRINITRGHVAKMIAKAFDLKEGAEEVDLIDLPADEEVAEAIRVLASNGIVSGFGKSKEFRPDALVTRGQFAKMVDLAMKVAPFRVVDVRALNGLELQITFSKPVDEDDVAGNVTLKYYNFVLESISDDGRTVVLMRHNGHLIVGENSTLRVNPVKSADYDNDKLKSEKYVTVFTYTDTEAPYVVDVDAKNKQAVITFNEGIYGLALSIDGQDAVPGTDWDWHATDDKAIIIMGLENGKTYEVVIVGAEDYAGNIADPIELTIKVVEEKAAAQDVTISASGSKVTLEFVNEVDDEEVSFAPAGGFTNPLVLDGVDDAGVEYSKDKKTVTLDAQLLGVLNGVSFLNTTVTVENGKLDEAVSKAVKLTADRVAPKFVSSEAKNDGTDLTLQLNFDKEVELSNVEFEITHVGGIKQSSPAKVTLASAYAKAAGKDVKTALVFVLPASFEAEESYTVKVAKDQLEDVYNNKVAEFTTTFTIPKAGAEDPAGDMVIEDLVLGLSDTNVIEIVLEFSENLADSSASAANFTLGGKALPQGAVVEFVNNKKFIQIDLPEGSIKTSGYYNLRLSNIVAKSGNTLADGEDLIAIWLDENVAPTITKAEAISNKVIQLTFSEDIWTSAADVLEVYVGGVKVGATHSKVSDTKTLDITLDEALTDAQLAAKIEVKVPAMTIDDVNGNFMKADTTVTVTVK